MNLYFNRHNYWCQHYCKPLSGHVSASLFSNIWLSPGCLLVCSNRCLYWLGYQHIRGFSFRPRGRQGDRVAVTATAWPSRRVHGCHGDLLAVTAAAWPGWRPHGPHGEGVAVMATACPSRRPRSRHDDCLARIGCHYRHGDPMAPCSNVLLWPGPGSCISAANR